MTFRVKMWAVAIDGKIQPMFGFAPTEQSMRLSFMGQLKSLGVTPSPPAKHWHNAAMSGCYTQFVPVHLSDFLEKLDEKKLNDFATQIADKIVPQYRNGKRSYSCNSHTAKRWNAAFNAAVEFLPGSFQAFDEQGYSKESAQ